MVNPIEPALMTPFNTGITGVDAVRVLVPRSTYKPALLPTVGDTYKSTKLPKQNMEHWQDYVYSGTASDAPDGYIGFWFLPALPTASQIIYVDDDIWGQTQVYTLIDKTNAAPPEIYTEYPAASSRYVLRVDPVESSFGSAVQMRRITTVGSRTATQIDNPIDPDTNVATTRTRTWTLATTSPSPTSVDGTGYYTSVEQVSYRLFLSTTQAATTLPTSEGAALTWPSMESLDIAWPAVLQSYNFYTILDGSASKVKDLLTYSLREPFAGEVKVENKLWWQATPLIMEPENQMISAGIRVGGNLMSFSIPECLHETFIYREQNLIIDGTSGALGMLIFAFGATEDTDWPDTITRIKQEFKGGGYQILKQVFYKPTQDGAEQALSVSVGPNTSTISYYD